MRTFTVSFFGHRRLERLSQTEVWLDAFLRKLLREKEYVEFLVGRDGEFDRLVAEAIRRYKRHVREDNHALVWVMPYETAAFRRDSTAYERYYDAIEVFEGGRCHYRSIFQQRNRYMVDRSELVVVYVDRAGGGAYQTLSYARHQGKSVLNIADVPR